MTRGSWLITNTKAPSSCLSAGPRGPLRPLSLHLARGQSAMSLAEGDRLEPAVEALLRTESWRAPAPAPPAPFALPLAACACTRRSRSGAVLTRWLRVAVWQGYADGQGGDEKAGAGSSARAYHARCASCLPARRGSHPPPSTAALHRCPPPPPRRPRRPLCTRRAAGRARDWKRMR